MNITINIDCSNAAFEDSPEFELSRILDNLAGKIESADLSRFNTTKLYDSNGALVGIAEVTR